MMTMRAQLRRTEETRIGALMDTQLTNTIRKELIDFIGRQTGMCHEIDASMNLIDRGVLDSLLVTDLVQFMQTRFEIELTPRDIAPENLSNIDQMVDLVRRKQEKQHHAA